MQSVDDGPLQLPHDRCQLIHELASLYEKYPSLHLHCPPDSKALSEQLTQSASAVPEHSRQDVWQPVHRVTSGLAKKPDLQLHVPLVSSAFPWQPEQSV